MLSRYLPADRLRAIESGAGLPERGPASLLLTDLASFSALAHSLVEIHSAERAPEVLRDVLDAVFGVVGRIVEQRGGSILAFSGDAASCYFGGDDGTAAAVAAIEIRREVAALAPMSLGAGHVFSPVMTSLVAAGDVRRVAVGDESFHLLEVVTGPAVARLDAAKLVAGSGEVIIDASVCRALGASARVSAARAARGEEFFALTDLDVLPVAPVNGPATTVTLDTSRLRPWISGPVYERALSGRGPFVAELRPVVALFAAYPGLAEREVEPADLDALVRWVQGVLERHGSSYLQFTTGEKGGYFYAAFGAPIAHADDVVAAIGAGLELADPPESLRAWTGAGSIGIAAGRAHAGEYGGARRSVYGVLGDVVNVAARLMGAAAPGEILAHGDLGATAQRRFATERAEPLKLKGKPHPLAVQRVRGLRAQRATRRDEPDEHSPIVGRNAELERVDALLAAAATGNGRTLAIEADAGVGKSRLVAEIIARAEARGMTVLTGEAPAFGGSVALAAWREVASGLFGIAASGSNAEREAALRAVVDAHMPGLAPQLPLLGPVLGLAIADNEHTSPIPAPVRKQIAQSIVVEMLRQRATRQPVLVVIEDAHWFDSASRDLADAVAAGTADSSIAFVVAHRPIDGDSAAVLGSVPAADRLTLAPLGTDAVGELVQLQLHRIFGVDEPAKSQLVDLVVERTAGNPLHVEELMRYLADLAIDPFDLEALSRARIPDSLQRVILERIDRLSERQREVVKVAAVVGRRFLASWLLGSDPGLGDEPAVHESLDRLSRLDITPVHETSPEIVYLFKHAVTRDVAYDTITHDNRVRLHASLGGFLESRLGAEAAPELLALHFGRGERPAKEMYYSALAAERAVQQAAYTEALAYLERGLSLATTLAAEPETAAVELRLLLAMGGALLIVKGQGSPEAKAIYDRAEGLCADLPRSPDVVRALFGLWTYYFFAGDAARSTALAGQILEVAEMIGAAEPRMNTHFAVSASAFLAGAPEECIRHADLVASLYDPSEAAGYVARYAQNPKVTAMTNACPALVLCGRYGQARALAAETIVLADSLGHELVRSIAMQVPAFMNVHLGDVNGAARAAAEWMPLAQKQGNPVYIAFCAAVLSWVQAASGDPAGLAQLRGVREGFLAQGVALADPILVTMTADAALRQGNHEEGLSLLDAFEPAARSRGQLAYSHEIRRLRAELMRLAGAPAPDVEACFGEALSLAAAQRAFGIGLRSALGLGELLRSQGRGDEARAIVAEALSLVDFDDAAPDVRAARAFQRID